MKKQLVKTYLLIFCFALLSALQAQDTRVFTFEEELEDQEITVRKFDQENLDDYSTLGSFDYTEAQESSNPIGRIISRFMNKLFTGIGKGFNSKTLQIVLVLVMIVVLAWFLQSSESTNFIGNKNNTAKRYVEELDIRVDENILLQKMQDSEANQSYRDALRYAYLLNLKSLNEAEKINWQEHKLSTDYLEELQDTALQEEFAAMTKYFNFGWYGNREISEKMYDKVKYTFSKLTDKITQRS